MKVSIFKVAVLSFGMFTVASTSETEAIAQSGTLRIVTDSLPPGVTNTNYSFSMVGAGGTPAYTWTASGLPAGLSMGNDGKISGKPTTPGTSMVTVTLRDKVPATVSKNFTLTVFTPLSITTAALPAGTVGAAYSQTLAASGGAAPYSWSVSAGSLPAGLSLASTGVISGTPTRPGNSNFTVEVDDGSSQSDTKALTITIPGTNLLVTTASPLPAGTTGTPYSQSLTAPAERCRIPGRCHQEACLRGSHYHQLE